MIKVAIAGVGGMGGLHFRIYNESESMEVVAAFDIREDILKEKIGDKKIAIYTDFDEMLKNVKADIIDISTPSFLHAEQTVKALNAGFNVICEKPMTLDSDSAKEVLRAAEKSGKLFMAAHVLRFMKNYMYLKKVTEGEKWGKLVRLDMKRLSSIPKWSRDNWMLNEDKSGLTPFDLTVHDVDFMLALFGEPKDIQCVRLKLKENNDYVIANHIYDGFTVSTEAAWYNAGIPFSASFYAVFENGYLSLRDGVLFENGEKVDFEDDEVIMDTGINISNMDGYALELHYFAECVKNGRRPEMALPESSAASVALIERMKKCAVEV